VKANGKHAQGTISYTTSPVHNMQMWVDLAKQIEDLGADSIAIKDMAGILTPYVAYELVSKLKASLSIPVHMQCHATAGLSSVAILKAVEAGIDNVDTSISSFSMTYGHSPTESVVAMFQNTEHDTGLDLLLLEEIAAYFREVRKKYAKFEGTLRGVDSRILVAQVPGGMLTNMEGQLKEQGASDKFDEVLAEIPRVREDLGFIPLVTPTSQIVGTQAVINVLTGERYKSITKETAGVLKGEYGAAPAPFNAELQARVLDGEKPVECRPADLIDDEVEKLTAELTALAKEKNIRLADDLIDDVLTYALFPQIGLKFLENRDNPDAFEPMPTGNEVAAGAESSPQAYTVEVNGQTFVVQVNEGGDIEGLKPIGEAAACAPEPVQAGAGDPQGAPLAGNIFKVLIKPGQAVDEGEVVIILEAMKMETEIRAFRRGVIGSVNVAVGDAVSVGDSLMTIR
jgi:oxaloacetate decarboxylase alpha subunit